MRVYGHRACSDVTEPGVKTSCLVRGAIGADFNYRRDQAREGDYLKDDDAHTERGTKQKFTPRHCRTRTEQGAAGHHISAVYALKPDPAFLRDRWTGHPTEKASMELGGGRDVEW